MSQPVMNAVAPALQRESSEILRPTVSLLLVAYVLSQAFDSVLRWVLNLVGLDPLIYLRDAGLALAILLCGLVLVHERRDLMQLFGWLWWLGAGVCISLYSGLSAPQILFGLKVWLPLFAGFLLLAAGALPALHRPRAWATLWAIVCTGVLVNFVYRYPWTGLAVQVGDVDVSANREWTAGGVQRLSGFSRSSYDAAILILVLYVYLIVSLGSRWVRLGLIAVSGLAIALTTSKGAMGAFLGTLLLLPFLGAGRRHRFLVYAPLTLAVLAAALPWMASYVPFAHLRPGSTEYWLLASFMTRLLYTWPDALGLLSGWQWLTGRGIGGIGVAQTYFEPVLANPADNLFVYLYVTAGAAGLAFYAYCATAARKLDLTLPVHRMAYLLLCCAFAYGLTVNLIESALFALAFGAGAAFLMRIGPAAHAGDQSVEARTS